MNRIVVYFISIGLLTMASTGWGQQEASSPAAAPPSGQSTTTQPAAAPPTAQPGSAVGQVNTKAKGKGEAKRKKVKGSGNQSSFVQPTRPAQAQALKQRSSGAGARLPSSRTAATSAALGDCPECLANAQAACARYGQDSKNCSILFGNAEGHRPGSGSGSRGAEVGR